MLKSFHFAWCRNTSQPLHEKLLAYEEPEKSPYVPDRESFVKNEQPLRNLSQSTCRREESGGVSMITRKQKSAVSNQNGSPPKKKKPKKTSKFRISQSPAPHPLHSLVI